jgi:hypothetical protein
MIVKILPSQAEILKYHCAVFELECHVYVMENNPLLMQAEILHENGADISSEAAWSLCSLVLSHTVKEIIL